MTLLRAVVELTVDAGAAGRGVDGSGGTSSIGDVGPPVIDRRALCAYPELKEFIVFDLVRVGESVATVGEDAVGFNSELAASWRSALSFFRSSFVCSPGQSAGTFISHLL